MVDVNLVYTFELQFLLAKLMNKCMHIESQDIR